VKQGEKMIAHRCFCFNCRELMIEQLGAKIANGWVPCLKCGHETYFNLASQLESSRPIHSEAAVRANRTQSTPSHLGATPAAESERQGADLVERALPPE
jgi:hypothetical protein